MTVTMDEASTGYTCNTPPIPEGGFNSCTAVLRYQAQYTNARNRTQGMSTISITNNSGMELFSQNTHLVVNGEEIAVEGMAIPIGLATSSPTVMEETIKTYPRALTFKATADNIYGPVRFVSIITFIFS